MEVRAHPPVRLTLIKVPASWNAMRSSVAAVGGVTSDLIAAIAAAFAACCDAGGGLDSGDGVLNFGGGGLDFRCGGLSLADTVVDVSWGELDFGGGPDRLGDTLAFGGTVAAETHADKLTSNSRARWQRIPMLGSACDNPQQTFFVTSDFAEITVMSNGQYAWSSWWDSVWKSLIYMFWSVVRAYDYCLRACVRWPLRRWLLKGGTRTWWCTPKSPVFVCPLLFLGFRASEVRGRLVIYATDEWQCRAIANEEHLVWIYGSICNRASLLCSAAHSSCSRNEASVRIEVDR